MTHQIGTLVVLGVVVACGGLASSTTGAQDTAEPRNWPWASGDERGAGNLITPETILDALSQVVRGEIIELSHDLRERAAHARVAAAIRVEHARHHWSA